MTRESPLRQLTRSLAGYARTLRTLATKSELRSVYNSLCDALDMLNAELEDEREGPITPDWKRFPITPKRF